LPGLWAVGNDAASIMGGIYTGPGITLGPGIVFGTLAGRAARAWHPSWPTATCSAPTRRRIWPAACTCPRLRWRARWRR
ncbi:MAG: hypothetical protein RLY78_59, partial [Pseudomonadota bacterium]